MSREPKKIGYEKGIACPECGCRDFYTRKTERKEDWIYRYKACRNCGRAIHTTESIDIERTGLDPGYNKL